MTRLLVLGRQGQLASALAATPLPTGWTAGFAGRDALDLTQPETIAAFLDAEGPDVVINTAAYTAVDAAEADEAGATALNATAPQALAEACHGRGRLLIHLSTDYVFSGDGDRPHGEDDPIGPLNAYGRTKAAGERGVLAADPDALVARTAWLLSPQSSFVRAILSRLKAGEGASVVDDQFGNPTHAGDLAAGLIQVAAARLAGVGAGGVLHMAGSQAASWYDLAVGLAAPLRLQQQIQPIASTAFGAKAVRPYNSRISVIRLKKVYDIALRPWTAWITETAQLGLIGAPKGVETRQQSGD